ncbi:MTEF2 factor, partial [Polypterus senegalus]
MFRVATFSLCLYYKRQQICLSFIRSFTKKSYGYRLLSTKGTETENACTIDSLGNLEVNISKVRQLKRWVLVNQVAYVNETAEFLREMGADKTQIASILERYPEAVLCTPTDVQLQREIWQLVCSNKKELLMIIEKFPSSFFTIGHSNNLKANIEYFKELGLNNKLISKVMASAPQNFSHPVEKNKEMICTLTDSYIKLGGLRTNMRPWLQKLLSLDPFILIKDPGIIKENLIFLHVTGFTSTEIFGLLTKLKGFISELSVGSMAENLAFTKKSLNCNDQTIKPIILKCPAILSLPIPILMERLQGLLNSGITLGQIKQTPAILELTSQIVQFRIQKLVSSGYDIKKEGLGPLTGTRKDFEISSGKIQLRKERPMFNPVAPLKIIR